MVQMLIQDSSPEGLEKISKKMPDTIDKALGFPVVSEVIRVVGEKTVVKYLEFELIKLAHLVSVGGNLNNSQVQFIAQELVKIFPHETLADFKLCFQRGAIGQYNIAGEKDIFRLDGIVIRRWMEKYLEEKYQVIENNLKDEKEDLKKLYTLTDQEAKTITDEVRRQQIKDRLQQWKTAIEGTANGMKIRPLTDDEIREEGQREPKKPKPYPWKNMVTQEDLIRRELHFQYLRENYDARTGHKLPNWMPEEEWIEKQKQNEK